MSSKIAKSVVLSSGRAMPLLGLGCSRQENTAASVETALDAGYRMIDTAFFYLNEKEVGEGISRWLAKGGGKREDIFVTTKLPSTGNKPELVEVFLKESLRNLNLDYVDLYLVHGPLGFQKTEDINDVFPKNEKNEILLDFSTDLIAVWKAMEKMADSGLARSIGVSNFSLAQMRKMLAIARIPPAVLQTELHVAYQCPELVKFCQQKGVALTSFASLGSPGRKTHSYGDPKFLDLLGHPVVALVAQNHDTSTSKVLLKFWVQQNISVIPKSSNPERIAANRELFDWTLSDTEMNALKTLDLGPEGKLFVIEQNSPLRMHPEFHDF